MKILRLAAIISLLLLASWLFIRFVLGGPEDSWICENGQWVKHGSPTYPQPVKKCGENVRVPNTQEECTANVGQWRKIGISPKESCDLPAADAGQTCFDSSECEGMCLAELTAEEKEAAMAGKNFRRLGQCSSRIVVVGCQPVVEKGQVNGLRCID